MVPRLLAAVALVAGVVAAVVIALGVGGGDGSPSGPGSSRSDSPPAGSRRIALPQIAAVRNAKPQPDWRPHPGPVPILHYHVVGIAPPETTATELFVSPADFRAQMGWLAAHDYEAVGLETVEASWFRGGVLPAKPIVLTFDGVRGDLLDAVVPALSRRGWPADLVLDSEGPLRTSAVARLVALGWGLEPSGRDPAAARRFVQSHLPTAARNFSYSEGESAGSDTSSLKAAGFIGATVTGGGFAEAAHPFALPRITIFNASRIDGFAEAIRSHGEGVGA